MRLLLVGVSAVLLLVGLIWVFQRRLVYFPSSEVPPPTAAAVSVEEVSFTTGDGLELEAWFLPPAPRAANSDATVVVFNGNAGNRAHRLPLGASLAGQGHAVLLVDYRGYGGNPGQPTETGLADDARAAFAYLRTRPDVDPDRLVYFGESLGAAVAIGLSVEHPPAALVLRSPFTSLADIASVHYPLLPASLLRDRYPSLERVGELGADVPVLVVAGSADAIVPPEQSRALFEASPAAVKRMVLVEGAGHNAPALVAGEEMMSAVDGFLASVLP